MTGEAAAARDRPGGAVHVVLVHPEIHWNTGNAGRTCLAAGACLHLVRPLGFSLADRRVRRAGLDYWSQVDLAVWDDWSRFEAEGPPLENAWFLSADGGRSLWEADLPGAPTATATLVFGSETRGLPPSLRERHRERLVTIPMPGAGAAAIRSLNLSTAVGVAVWEALRRRAQAGATTPAPGGAP